MTEIDFPLLKEISETPAAPGHEKPLRDKVLQWVKPLVDELSVDNMGNITAIKRGSANVSTLSTILNRIGEQA